MKPVFRPAAAADIEDAYRWYETQRAGLGGEFLSAVSETLNLLTANPKKYPVIHRETRRALVRRFPYGLFYRLVDDQIVVVACFHASRDPRRWQSRS